MKTATKTLSELSNLELLEIHSKEVPMSESMCELADEVHKRANAIDGYTGEQRNFSEVEEILRNHKELPEPQEAWRAGIAADGETEPFKQMMVINDGGRAQAGYKGVTGDCVTRAVAIATGKPYQEIYDLVNELGKKERVTKRRKKHGKSSARTGVYKATSKKLIRDLGWEWIPTMKIGSGCQVHFRADELPTDRTIIVKLSKHISVMVDGVIHDTYDCSRGGSRCVYGYWQKPEISVAKLKGIFLEQLGDDSADEISPEDMANALIDSKKEVEFTPELVAASQRMAKLMLMLRGQFIKSDYLGDTDHGIEIAMMENVLRGSGIKLTKRSE
jgi:hypothetical protein